MTTYLVTGGTGFLGRHLLDRLLARDDAEVYVVVRAALGGEARRPGRRSRVASFR